MSPYVTYKYYDPETRKMRRGKCDRLLLDLFKDSYVYLDRSNPQSTPLIRVGFSGPSGKALVLHELKRKPWSPKVKGRKFSRHIACKNGDPSDLRAENLAVGRCTRRNA